MDGSGMPRSGALRSFAEFIERQLGGGRPSWKLRVDLLSAAVDVVLFSACVGDAEPTWGNSSRTGACAGLVVLSLVLAGIRTIPAANPSLMARRLSLSVWPCSVLHPTSVVRIKRASLDRRTYRFVERSGFICAILRRRPMPKMQILGSPVGR